MVAVAMSTQRPTSGNPPRTEGLTALDRDRSASVADEGGTSAATVEVQRPANSRNTNETDSSKTTQIARPKTSSEERK